jgi:leucyl aminopeptidase
VPRRRDHRGLILARFAKSLKWAHLDIAGTATVSGAA